MGNSAYSCVKSGKSSMTKRSNWEENSMRQHGQIIACCPSLTPKARWAIQAINEVLSILCLGLRLSGFPEMNNLLEVLISTSIYKLPSLNPLPTFYLTHILGYPLFLSTSRGRCVSVSWGTLALAKKEWLLCHRKSGKSMGNRRIIYRPCIIWLRIPTWIYPEKTIAGLDCLQICF